MLINLIKTRNACLSFSLAVSQAWVKIVKLFQTNKDYVKRFKIMIRVNTGCLSPYKKMLEKEGRKKKQVRCPTRPRTLDSPPSSFPLVNSKCLVYRGIALAEPQSSLRYFWLPTCTSAAEEWSSSCPSRQNWTRLRITNRQIQLVVRAVQRVWTLGHTAPCSRSPVPGPSPSHSRVRVGICAYVSVIINKTMGGNSVEMLSSSQRSLRWLFDKDSHLLTCPLGVLSLPGPAEITIKCDNVTCSWTYESNKSFK